MTIWYDVSDLMAWRLPHLTGIQRTTVGILNGLSACGETVELVRYDAKAGRFAAVAQAALPAEVRRHLRGATGEQAAGDPPVRPAPVTKPSGPGKGKRRRLLGTGPEAEELRLAFRRFKHAARSLGRAAGRWTAGRIAAHLPAHSSSAADAVRRPSFPLDTSPAATELFAASDVLLSLGASWCIPGHAAAAALARTRGVRLVRMVYDLVPTLKPQWLHAEPGRDFTLWVRSVLAESDVVLTISEFSRQAIERYCHECRCPVPDLRVVRLGDVMGPPADAVPATPLPRFVPRRPFFLCVSTLDVRKNHRLLYDAWTRLAARRGEECPDLVCVGVRHLHVDDLLWEITQDRDVNRHMHVLEKIEDSELEWYYRHCQATVYPSKYEGWGLPVAESLGHGRLCLASNATSIPEISADLPAFFDPCDVLGLAALVERVLDEPDWVREREAAIRAEFRPTEWRETAAQVLAAIGETAPRARLSVWPHGEARPDDAPRVDFATSRKRAA